MGFFDWTLFGDSNEDIERKYNKKVVQPRQQRREDAISGVNDTLSTLKERLGSANRRAGMSVRDLYGDSIDRSADMTRSNANATKSALTRLGSARGADVTGAQNSIFNRIDENTNEDVSNIIQHYTDRASTDREQAQARGDRLTGQVMKGNLNLASLAEQELMRQLQKRQAAKQRRSGLLGGLFQGIGSAIGCWVAEELYGKWSPITFSIRVYVFEQSDRWTPTGLFARAYRRFGKSWARWCRKSGCVRRVAGFVFERLRKKAVDSVEG